MTFEIVGEGLSESSFARALEEFAGGDGGVARLLRIAKLNLSLSLEQLRFGLDGLARSRGRCLELDGCVHQTLGFLEDEASEGEGAVRIGAHEGGPLLARVEQRKPTSGVAVERAEARTKYCVAFAGRR